MVYLTLFNEHDCNLLTEWLKENLKSPDSPNRLFRNKLDENDQMCICLDLAPKGGLVYETCGDEPYYLFIQRQERKYDVESYTEITVPDIINGLYNDKFEMKKK